MSDLGSIGPEDKKRLDETVRVGLQQLQEIDDIRESLKDLVKTVSEEMNIKPKNLMSAIRMAHKATLADKKDELDTVEEILHVTGHC